jgi:hydrogenase nickel incorporation protein HypB
MERVSILADVRRSNDEIAAENQTVLHSSAALTINLMSAPGAGKTTVLENTIRRMSPHYRLAVIEGDLQTSIDSERILALGVPAHQITTGTVCHLDARMVARAIAEFPFERVDVLFIENVGNLVCPAEFNLGEDLRVMVYSVVEGEEKPKKYPLMFHKADAVLLNKIDLVAYAGVELGALKKNVFEVNPRAAIFPVSCRTGEGIEAWTQWLAEKIGPQKVSHRDTQAPRKEETLRKQA